ncbi:MAG: hypothetical protein U0804_12715 [Gemmataceae bacterium]
METVGDVLRALAQLPEGLPVAVLVQQTDGDKYAMPVERVVKRPAAVVLKRYGLEVDEQHRLVALVSALEHD